MEDFKMPTAPIPGPMLPNKPEDLTVEQKKTECPYNVPKWSGGLAPRKYSFEVLKNGMIIEEIKDLHTKPYWVFGRLPLDIFSAHPTTSRYHCVLQYKPRVENEDQEEEIKEGWFVYDLDSTHGTFINRNRIRPKTYIRLSVGHQLKLGNSTRSYILVGPSEDEEEESEFTVTELRQQRVEREKEKERLAMEEKARQEQIAKDKENEGISWGMSEDAEEETDLSENPFAQTNNEELFVDDPKKTLRGYFEREGHNLDYRCDELSPGVFLCKVELPIDDECGNPIICEIQHKGKKKECVVQCALEACRILDRHGVLRQSHHEPRRSKKINESDSDDDTFFDRTGDVEKKRLKKIGSHQQEALTYEQLMEQEQEIVNRITSLELKLEIMVENERRIKQQQNASEEDLDAFMSQLSHDKIDKFGIRNIKMDLQNLKIEHAKIQKLISIAKPSIVLPPVTEPKSKVPLFGKRNKLPRDFGIKKSSSDVKKKDVSDFQVEEEEDDDEKERESKESEKSVKEESKQESNATEITSKSEKTPAEKKEVKPHPAFDIEDSEPTIKKQKLETLPADPQPTPTSVPQPPTATSGKQKKKRQVKNREFRANVDMNDDDEYIDEEKVSMWVAPDDQQGDGKTKLNEKFGY